jgi:lipopolysaccharide/colanic/teichoic acid biosynthesis glycosyltransferase
LRRTSIDELPQLINVVRGDMSLVGPRPELPYFVERFSASVPSYADRLRVPGGITGLAQIHGRSRGLDSIPERVRLDNSYIETRSLWGDILILFRTLEVIFRGDRDCE